MKKCNLV